jgi:SAM-dependent methyltransferase
VTPKQRIPGSVYSDIAFYYIIARKMRKNMGMRKLLRRLRRKLFGEKPAQRAGLTPQEEVVWNEGERLIPWITHDALEVVRHTSSYLFFRKFIEADLAFDADLRRNGVRIVDLGCGVGHGCLTLSTIQGARISGVDVFPDCVEYARSRFAADNVTYYVADLNRYIPEMPVFDYVVSRGVLEHLPEGLALARRARWRNRLLIDVPYDETPGVNPHHVLTGIREKDFADFGDAELFYQDLDGVIYDVGCKPPRPNMIICVMSRLGLPRSGRLPLAFPVPAWRSDPGTAVPR